MRVNNRHKEYDSVQILKQIARDSLNEISYKSGKEFFDKKYNEVKDMITFSNEIIKAKSLALIVTNYINNKNNGVSNKEFQQKLNDRADKVVVLQEVILQFALIAAQIKVFENIQNFEFKYEKGAKAEFKKLANQAKSKLKREQQRDFPLLRKEYAKIISETLWRNNIKVNARGGGNSRLEFTSGIFINNANIDDFQKNVLIDTKALENILLFRFKRIAYKWHDLDEQYTYYKYDTPDNI